MRSTDRSRLSPRRLAAAGSALVLPAAVLTFAAPTTAAPLPEQCEAKPAEKVVCIYHTPGTYTFTVPDGVELTAAVTGASGGPGGVDPQDGGAAGLGGKAAAGLDVAGGTTLTLIVGEAGRWNGRRTIGGGGASHTNDPGDRPGDTVPGGSGGGGSFVQTTDGTNLLVAGGGGGGGAAVCVSDKPDGGAGGGRTGRSGSGACPGGDDTAGAGGGSDGGSGVGQGTDGMRGRTVLNDLIAGGGGGGYDGGQGGAVQLDTVDLASAGGGGGSGYCPPGTCTAFKTGVNSGDGTVVLTYESTTHTPTPTDSGNAPTPTPVSTGLPVTG